MGWNEISGRTRWCPEYPSSALRPVNKIISLKLLYPINEDKRTNSTFCVLWSTLARCVFAEIGGPVGQSYKEGSITKASTCRTKPRPCRHSHRCTTTAVSLKSRPSGLGASSQPTEATPLPWPGLCCHSKTYIAHQFLFKLVGRQQIPHHPYCFSNESLLLFCFKWKFLWDAGKDCFWWQYHWMVVTSITSRMVLSLWNMLKEWGGKHEAKQSNVVLKSHDELSLEC